MSGSGNVSVSDGFLGSHYFAEMQLPNPRLSIAASTELTIVAMVCGDKSSPTFCRDSLDSVTCNV